MTERKREGGRERKKESKEGEKKVCACVCEWQV